MKPVWRMKTSSSLTDSPIETEVSLSENFLTVHLVRGMPRRLATCSASWGCELPVRMGRSGAVRSECVCEGAEMGRRRGGISYAVNFLAEVKQQLDR